MRSLIVEDEFVSRMTLKCFLDIYGPCDQVKNGSDAVSAFLAHSKQSTPYNLICLDIQMPGMDGHEVLEKIRAFEDGLKLTSTERVKIFMTTAVVNAKSIFHSFHKLCDEFISKPVESAELETALKKHGLLS